jgi:hypothetical protein
MKCNNPWLYLGIISGFLSGFFYFAYGVYTHGRSHHVGPSSGYASQPHYNKILEQ